MRRLNKEEIEDIALRKLRNHSDKKLLSNTNVDCFCMGYSTCQDRLLSLSSNPKEFKKFLIEHAQSVLDDTEMSIAYSGHVSNSDAEKRTFFKYLINFLTENEE